MAFFSKSPDARLRFIEANMPTDRIVLHLHPKNLRRAPLAGHVVSVSYEDVTKRDVWLRINSLISDDTFLVLENPSRYPKITSEKVKFLRRLSMRFRGDRILTDIVPFTESVEYLYTPYSYLGREILGYPHWYAFRENYQEIDASGKVVNALDFDVLARKAATVTRIDYAHFLAQDRHVVPVTETDGELTRYADKRELLFAKAAENTEGNYSPQKIITRLADLTHSFDSRMRALLDLAATLKGETVIFTNLLSYAKTAQRALKAAGHDHCRATSYQIGDPGISTARNVVYMESPIVHAFYFLDVESAIRDDCSVYHMLGETGVDKHLHTLITHEITQIDGFTTALWEATHV